MVGLVVKRAETPVRKGECAGWGRRGATGPFMSCRSEHVGSGRVWCKEAGMARRRGVRAHVELEVQN